MYKIHMVSIRRPEHGLGSWPTPRGANAELEKTWPRGESGSVGCQDETVMGKNPETQARHSGGLPATSQGLQRARR